MPRAASILPAILLAFLASWASLAGQIPPVDGTEAYATDLAARRGSGGTGLQWNRDSDRRLFSHDTERPAHALG